MSQRVRYAIQSILVNALALSSLYHILIYLANRRFWRQLPPPPPDTAPSISAVVPLFGKTLDTLSLLHLLGTHRPTDRYEVLLVLESEASPAYVTAREAAEAYPGTLRIVIGGPAGEHVPAIHALRAGYEAAQGDLIAFVEPDVHITPELWNAALATLADPAVSAAFAPPLVLEPERRDAVPAPTGGETLVALHANHARAAALPLAALTNRVRAMANGFMIVRRSALQQAGGLTTLLDEADPAAALGRLLRAHAQPIAVLPVPAQIVPRRQSTDEGMQRIVHDLAITRVYNPRVFAASPFTNPLTVGFILGWITEREGRWWGRRTWWGFAAFRLLIAYALDRLRFGRAFNLAAYAQLFMLDTFVSPVLWLRALVRRTITTEGRTYRLYRGGQTVPEMPKDAA
ncbi:glycosyltransferase [Aggregatilinea lenta]|uniref:glycosyltransferase n=1 Tax=Aggregatilinea lenta TaxID=913108 RepID=UPI000E5B3446|nr:glycosyltransferase [Aggregatilinea lenta]